MYVSAQTAHGFTHTLSKINSPIASYALARALRVRVFLYGYTRSGGRNHSVRKVSSITLRQFVQQVGAASSLGEALAIIVDQIRQADDGRWIRYRLSDE